MRFLTPEQADKTRAILLRSWMSYAIARDFTRVVKNCLGLVDDSSVRRNFRSDFSEYNRTSSYKHISTLENKKVLLANKTNPLKNTVINYQSQTSFEIKAYLIALCLSHLVASSNTSRRISRGSVGMSRQLRSFVIGITKCNSDNKDSG